MQISRQAYDIIDDWFEHHEGFIMKELQIQWPLEYAYAIVAEHKSDSGFDPRSLTVKLSTLCDQIEEENTYEFLESIRKIIEKFTE